MEEIVKETQDTEEKDAAKWIGKETADSDTPITMAQLINEICGYMTYEEAMDASLENSLILQEMYPSWEEMMNFYMLGYQFWKNDPATTEDSPTMERYRYYEMLHQTENGPYSLE